jgi:hypothetical protein
MESVQDESASGNMSTTAGERNTGAGPAYEEKLVLAKAQHAAEVARITEAYDRAVKNDKARAEAAATSALPAAPPAPRRGDATIRGRMSRAEQAALAEQMRLSWAAFLGASEVADALATLRAMARGLSEQREAIEEAAVRGAADTMGFICDTRLSAGALPSCQQC